MSRVPSRLVVRSAATDDQPVGRTEPLVPDWQTQHQQAHVARIPRPRTPPDPSRRGRHVARRRRVNPRISPPAVPYVLGALCLLLVTVLSGVPYLAVGHGDYLAPRELLALLTGASLPVIAIGLVRRRHQLGPSVTLASALFALGTALQSCYLVTGATSGWLNQGGHLAWLAATPVFGIGLRLDRKHHHSNPHAFTLLFIDAAMMACAWLTMLWRQFIWQGQPWLLDAGWADLWMVALDLFVLCLVVLVATTLADLGVMMTTTAVLLITATDVIVVAGLAGAQYRIPAPLNVLFGSVLMCLVWPVLIAGLVIFSGRSLLPRVGDLDPDPRVGLVTLFNVLVPVGIAFGGLAALLTIDRTSILLAGLVVLAFGIRELVRARQSAGLVELLADQAMHDPLTGLSNRRALGERLAELAESGLPATVLTLDVDRFKLVNTEFGHSIGDDVLASVGVALRETCSPLAAQPFRLGGDEFAVIAVGDDDVGLMLAERVRTAVVRHTRAVPGMENLALTASVGVAPLQCDGDPLAVLARSAEALRVAKQDRNRVRFYTHDLLAEAVRRTQLETRLRRAIDLRAVTFHYQPIVDLRSGRVLGMESLARWQDEELGHVSPADFVPMAEQTGLIHDLGRQAIESALRVAAGAGPEAGRLSYVAVNVSPLQLRRSQFVDEVADLVTALRAEPSMLKLEVTEGIFMDHDDPAVENLRRLSGLGIGIAIDDFGSGYSSLGYMSRLPIETVKVDRMLTSQVDDSRTRSVVKALVWVAEAHGLQVILEGVETEQTAATLRRLGVRWGQGWLWSRAVPEAEVPGVLADLGTVPLLARRADSHLSRVKGAGSAYVG